MSHTARTAKRRLRNSRERHLPAPFSSEMGLLALGAALLVVVLFPFDGRISAAMGSEPPGARRFLGVATDAGLSAWYVYPAALLLLLLAATDWRHHARIGKLRMMSFYAHAGFLAASVGAAALGTQILKTIFGRARPALIDQEGAFAFHPFEFSYLYASFPSGHSTTVGAVTMVAMLLFPALRVPALIVGICLALSRVAVLAHYPSDVVAGFAFGGLATLTLARWLARRRVLFGYPGGTKGWGVLLPERFGHWRDFGAHTAIGSLRFSRRR